MMCRRYHCLPSQLLAEDTQVIEMLRLLEHGDAEGSGYEQ